MKRVGLILALMLVLGLLLAGSAQAAMESRSGQMVTVKADETTQGDLLCSGNSVVINGTVSGDLVVTAIKVTINGKVKGSVIGYVGTYQQKGSIGGNVRLILANQASFQGSVGGIISVWDCSRLEIGQQATAGGLTSKSTELLMNGTIDGRMESTSEKIWIDGTVTGDCLATTPLDNGYIYVKPHAKLGSFSYYSPKQPVIDPEAVTGKLGKLPTPRDPNVMTTEEIIFRWVWFLGTIMIGLIFMRLFPLRVIQWGTTVVPLVSTCLLGIGVILGSLVAIGLLVFTGIGTPLALLLGALFVALILVCQLPAYLYIGSGLIRLFKVEKRFPVVFLLFIGGVIMFLLSTLPVPLGGIFNGFATVLGLGLLARRPRGMIMTPSKNGPGETA